MSDCCVVVVNGSLARLLTIETAAVPELESGPRLVETERLQNQDSPNPTQPTGSDRHSGGNRSPAGGAHGYDAHRDQHRHENERRFAREIVHKAASLAAASQAKRVVLVAEKHMMGLLRETLGPLWRAGVKIAEVPKDLSKMDVQSIQQHLARQRLVPQRAAPQAHR